MNDLNLLQANFAEIFAALDAAVEGQPLPLFSTSSSKIYYRGTWLGRAIHWMWASRDPLALDEAMKTIMTNCFNGCLERAYEGRRKRLWHHVRQIDRTLNSNISDAVLTAKIDRYVQFLTNESPRLPKVRRSAEPLTEDEERAHRHQTCNFHNAAYEFWSLFIKDDPLKNLLMPFLEPASLLTNRSLFKAMTKEDRWVQLEGEMQQSIPIALFSKLHNPQSLTVNENVRLRSWVQRLNACRTSLPIDLIAKVFKEVIKIIRIQGDSPLTYADLIFWLDQQGCQSVREEDPVHLDWRAKLRPGETIFCNGIKLVLGRQLSPEKEIDDHFIVFELANSPHVVKIAHNRFLLMVEDKQSNIEKMHWGFRLVEKIKNINEEGNEEIIDGLDEKGRCVVLEKLEVPFDRYKWTSTAPKLTQEDENYALPFANHLFCMKEWWASAQNLSLDHLMHDKMGVLKSTRLLRKGSPNYNEWEGHCIAAARGNPWVLSFLMHVSKLKDHPVAKFYQGAVEYTLKTGQTDLIGRDLPLDHREEVYERKVIELCNTAKELKKMCFEYVRSALQKTKKDPYSHEQKPQLEQEITRRLIQVYQASLTPGHLPYDETLEVIKASFASDADWRSSKWTASTINFLEYRAYYDEKFDLMISHNKKALEKSQETIKAM